MPSARALAMVGAVVLVATAIFHMTGYSGVATEASSAEISSFLAAAVKALWIFPSYHWFLIALVCVVATGHPGRLARIVLMGSAVVLAVDALLLLWAIGPFLGELLLGSAAAAFFGAGLRLEARTP